MATVPEALPPVYVGGRRLNVSPERAGAMVLLVARELAAPAVHAAPR